MGAGYKIDSYYFLVKDLLEESKTSKQIRGVLYKYNISNVEILQYIILNYIFSIEDENLKSEVVDMLAEANNIPIITECNSVINHGCNMEKYIKGKSKIKIAKKRFYICIDLINMSSVLQTKKMKIEEENSSKRSETGVYSRHRYRRSTSMYD
ncbi:MAG: hypothetical protein RR290_00390 [Clostridia bacterium]